MLKIQVLGSGLIPRGHGIAPKKDPFPADLTLIGTILSTPGLKLNYIHPETNKPVALTRDNYQRVFKAHGNVPLKQKEEVAEADGIVKTGIAAKPDGSVNELTVTPPVAPPGVVIPPAVDPAAEKKDDAGKEEFVVTPIVKQEEGPKVDVVVGNNSNRPQNGQNQNNQNQGNKGQNNNQNNRNNQR